MFTQEQDTFVTHFINEHKRLHCSLAGIRASMRVPAATMEVLAAQLTAMRDELAHHFEEEERGGCIEEAICRLPRLAVDAQRLQREHELLLSELGRLIRRCSLPNKLSRQQFNEEFEEFLVVLRRHENSENKLVQAGFNVEIDLQERASS